MKNDNVKKRIITFYIIQLICVIITLRLFYINISENIYRYINILWIYIGIDLISYIILVYKEKTKKDNGKILFYKRYKKDVDYYIKKYSFIFEILKVILFIINIRGIFQFQNLMDNSKFEIHGIGDKVILFAISQVAFYVFLINILYKLNPDNDNVIYKSKLIKKLLKNKLKKEINIIIVDNENIYSTFQNKIYSNIKLNKKNIYINKKDIQQLDSIQRNLILKNVVSYISLEDNLDKIVQDVEIDEKYFYESCGFKNYHNYYIFGIKDDTKEKVLPKELVFNNSVKICKSKFLLQYVEELICKNYIYIPTEIDDKLIINFYERAHNDIPNIPKDKFMINLLRNGIVNESPYQSTLILFNYLLYLQKVCEYYVISKYPNIKAKESEKSDGEMDICANMLVHLYKNGKDILYKSLRKDTYRLSENDFDLLHEYFYNILGIDISNGTMNPNNPNIFKRKIKHNKSDRYKKKISPNKNVSYESLVYMYLQFRNKVQAHGSITEDNVYAIWNLEIIFVKMFNYFLKPNLIDIEYLENKEIKMKYIGDNIEVILGKNMIYEDKNPIIRVNSSYVNFFTGEDVIPSKM